jgi:hypothetical protein
VTNGTTPPTSKIFFREGKNAKYANVVSPVILSAEVRPRGVKALFSEVECV